MEIVFLESKCFYVTKRDDLDLYCFNITRETDNGVFQSQC